MRNYTRLEILSAKGGRIVDVEKLTAEIVAITNADVGRLPVLRTCVWYPPKTPEEVMFLFQVDARFQTDTAEAIAEKQRLVSDLSPTVFRQGQPCPLHDSSVFAIFEGDPLRVYTLTANGRAYRFNLSPRGPRYTIEVMGIETFKACVAAEWEMLAEETEPPSPDDEEDVEETLPNKTIPVPSPNGAA